MKILALSALSLLLAGPALADPPVIKNVSMKQSGGTWTFDVTIQHGDTGWEDYADGWRVLDAQGNQLGYRKLAHPHVEEQPFTRSLSGVRIPEGTTEVGIQASDSVGGWSSAIKTVRLR